MDRFSRGDLVALRSEYLGADPEDISCLRAIRAGWPNEFEVLAEAETLDGVRALRLSPCCGRLRSPRTGREACAAHPARLFEVLRRAERTEDALGGFLSASLPEDPAFFLSLDLPLLGPVVRFAHYVSEEAEGVELRIAGARPVRLVGRRFPGLREWLRGLKIAP